uniref:Thioredoxin n=1 Tax=Candidatus Kentrum sp. TUN TaxID=2126343 RepID=A0A450ZNQ9_9GAMM|nr:MAG: Thioredoxin [Candidatus Kentron sp. TUN]VFK57455.1 MAG: Thioredoxin [Candidatus Kentron sp. TUN]
MQHNKKLRNMVLGGIAILSLIALGPREVLAGNRALFQLDGMDYMESDLPSGSQLDLYEIENEYYQKLDAFFDDVLFDLYLEEESKRLGKSKEEIKMERLSVPEPDQASVRAFYDNSDATDKPPYESVQGKILRYLREVEIQKKWSALLTDYREKNNFELLLPRAIPPLVKIDTEGFPFKGDPQANITMVEFADYQCGHCKTAANAMERTLEHFPGKLKAVYMDYPINRSGISRLVAQGAVCADEQGKFWPYHDLAYQRQDTLSKSSPIGLAKDVGLDLREFTHCFQSQEAAEKVARSKAEAKRLHLSGTPVIFVNGKRILLHHHMEEDLRQAVEKELAHLAK